MVGLFYDSLVCGEKIIAKIGRCLHALRTNASFFDVITNLTEIRTGFKGWYFHARNTYNPKLITAIHSRFQLNVVKIIYFSNCQNSLQ